VGIEKRRFERVPVKLSVSYSSAARFVTDYAENLSIGGLFVAGAHQLQRLDETEVTINLPGRGSWQVRAKVVFIFDEDAARKAGRRPGAGMELIHRPPGFEDALLGYLVHLGRRREVAVMLGEVPGGDQIGEAGYRIVPLVHVEGLAAAIVHAVVPIVAVVVNAEQLAAYRRCALDAGAGEIVLEPSDTEDAADLVAKIDSLL
jgi:hypothetical protein